MWGATRSFPVWDTPRLLRDGGASNVTDPEASDQSELAGSSSPELVARLFCLLGPVASSAGPARGRFSAATRGAAREGSRNTPCPSTAQTETPSKAEQASPGAQSCTAGRKWLGRAGVRDARSRLLKAGRVIMGRSVWVPRLVTWMMRLGRYPEPICKLIHCTGRHHDVLSHDLGEDGWQVGGPRTGAQVDAHVLLQAINQQAGQLLLVVGVRRRQRPGHVVNWWGLQRQCCGGAGTGHAPI